MVNFENNIYFFTSTIIDSENLPDVLTSILLQKGTEEDSHAVCIITNSSSRNNIQPKHLSEFPTVSCDCQMIDNEFAVFIHSVQQGVISGCSVRIIIPNKTQSRE